MTDAGSLIRDRRLAHRLSQGQLARRAGTSQAAISKLENGETSPSIETLARILRVMGEELSLAAMPTEHRYSRADLAHELRRPMRERLEGALAWNDFADEIGGAAARTLRSRSR
jgi:transcriptional regulator with XRE-family HTH domain